MIDARALFGSSEAEVSAEWTLPLKHLGQQVVVFSRIDSTNTQALRLSDRPDCAGLALLADEQLAGRGQQGRLWVAPPRSSVLLSILLFPPDWLTRPVLLTAWAAVAVCRLLQSRIAVMPRIKWPNDVLVRDRKVCGILIEQARHGTGSAVVLGIGLNITLSEGQFAAAGLPLATSLHACGDPCPDRDEITRQLLSHLDEAYDHLLAGLWSSLEASWVGFLGLVQEEVVVETTETILGGRLIEIGFAGLRLVRPGHSPVVLAPETIRHIERR